MSLGSAWSRFQKMRGLWVEAITETIWAMGFSSIGALNGIAAIAPPLHAALQQLQGLHDEDADRREHADDDEIGRHAEAVAVDRQQPAETIDRGIELGDDGVDERERG